MYESKISLKQPHNNINLDIFQKIAISTKIISGTYNLNKTIEKDTYVEKYKNYKVMEYASKVLKAFQP